MTIIYLKNTSLSLKNVINYLYIKEERMKIHGSYF